MSSFQAAIADLDWAKAREFYISLTDASSADAYPIMAASFVLIRKYPKDSEHSRDVLHFFRWALENGRDLATSLDYLPLPPPLVRQVEGYWNAEFEAPPKVPQSRERFTNSWLIQESVGVLWVVAGPTGTFVGSRSPMYC